MFGLYVPCGMAQRCGGGWFRGKWAGRLLRGEQKGDHAQGMQTHRRTACAG